MPISTCPMEGCQAIFVPWIQIDLKFGKFFKYHSSQFWVTIFTANWKVTLLSNFSTTFSHKMFWLSMQICHDLDTSLQFSRLLVPKCSKMCSVICWNLGWKAIGFNVDASILTFLFSILCMKWLWTTMYVLCSIYISHQWVSHQLNIYNMNDRKKFGQLFWYCMF